MAKALPLESLSIYSNKNLPSTNVDFNEGAIILINKPKEWTSFDVVKVARGAIKTKKVGHAGTLDPAATGLLVICAGKATKSISQIQELEKTYVAEIKFGGSTPSYDADSEVDETAEFNHITLSDIQNKLKESFSGEIQQVPPMYSALKRDGKRLYELARRGETIELEPRPVTIHDFTIMNYEPPLLLVSIKCSKGTYIRSIAHDLGIALGSRAHLSNLIRTAIGHFSVNDALTPDEIRSEMKRDNG